MSSSQNETTGSVSAVLKVTLFRRQAVTETDKADSRIKAMYTEREFERSRTMVNYPPKCLVSECCVTVIGNYENGHCLGSCRADEAYCEPVGPEWVNDVVVIEEAYIV